MEDLKLRDRLAALADEVPPQTFAPAGLTRRARRRAALVLGAIVVCLALATVGLSAGVRAFLRSEGTRPAEPPALAPGTIVTVVGSGRPGTAGIGGPATQAQLTAPIDSVRSRGQPVHRRAVRIPDPQSRLGGHRHGGGGRRDGGVLR